MTEMYLFYILATLIIMGYATTFLISHLLKWRRLESHTDTIDTLPASTIWFWIALAAALSIFVELMVIRLHSSYFHLFAYLKNVSLLSCFLGLGMGYLLGSKRPLLTPLIMPFLAFEIITLHVLKFTPLQYYLQNPIPEQLILGLEQSNLIENILITYPFLIIVFFFNALCFIPFGQLISRLMARQTPLVSYNWNLIGSLVGILLFGYISFLWTPPSVWILWTGIGVMMFLRKDTVCLFISLAAMTLTLMFLSMPLDRQISDIYSPYQKLSVYVYNNSYPVVGTNNVYYQRILDLREENIRHNSELKKWSEYYHLPYTFKPKPKQVLVVGSGTGNDVAAALRNEASHVDAVEIDPAILKIGKELHAEAPYNSSKVHTELNDARAFIRHTQKNYDLIVYGLLDSHTLLSSKSGGIRLDSYVYTVEAFRDARAKLNKDGIICLTFCVMRPELGRKLFLMLQEAFDGQKPRVFQAVYDGGYAFIIGDNLDKNAFHISPTLKEITSEMDNNKIIADKSTDDWPFLYMPVKKYPLSYLAIILTLLFLSFLFIRKLIPTKIRNFSIPCFFLGAGFMLVETKGITELALVYGSTWMVTSIVIAAILLMAFFSNMLVMKNYSASLTSTYICLVLSLIPGFILTFVDLGQYSPWLAQIMMPLALTLPLFFSGIAFSMELKKSNSTAVALASNLLGAMLGGFLEYNSMYFGFRSLYVLALIMYLCAFLGTKWGWQK